VWEIFLFWSHLADAEADVVNWRLSVCGRTGYTAGFTSNNADGLEHPYQEMAGMNQQSLSCNRFVN
jgi:hypothetical protein